MPEIDAETIEVAADAMRGSVTVLADALKVIRAQRDLLVDIRTTLGARCGGCRNKIPRVMGSPGTHDWEGRRQHQSDHRYTRCTLSVKERWMLDRINHSLGGTR